MKWFAWAIASLGLLTAVPATAAGQESQGERVELRQNYPNPFNPETTIPFALPARLFADGKTPVVSLKIYNVLAQLVAIPILQQGSGQPLDNLRVQWNGTGEYTGFWDGKILGNQRVEAPSGVYVYQLVVNGERLPPRKMTIAK